MRLLFILPEYLPASGGGIVTFYRHLLPSLAKRGHEVRVISGSGVSTAVGDEGKDIDGVYVETLDYNLFRSYWQRMSHLGALATVRRYLAGAWAAWEQARYGEGADLIETTDWGLLFLPPVLEASCPVVVQLHGSCGQIDTHDPAVDEEEVGVMLRLLELAGLGRADRLQTPSLSNAEFWRRQTGREIEPILPAWRSLHEDEDQEERGDRGLVVARVQHWKGPRILCAALDMLGASAPTIDWVGRDMPGNEPGETVAGEMKRSFPHVWGMSLIHHRPVPAEAMTRLYHKAGFVIVPSTWDVFNLTCVEAMAAGRPVICSTGAGACELIEDGRNGFLFAAGDARSLAEAINRVLGLSDAERNMICSAARETATSRLDPDAILEMRVSAYHAAINAFGGRKIEPDDFLRQACAGRDVPRNEMAFLSRLPLKSVLRHSGGRVYGKLIGRAPHG